MSPLVLIAVVLLVWVVLLMVWVTHQEVRLRAQQKAQMQLHAMFTQDLAKESREKDRLIRYLDCYIKEVAHTALPSDVWIRIEIHASRLLED